MFQHWMKYGLLASALSAVPFQAAVAFAPQWRPAAEIAAPPAMAAPVAQPAQNDPRFRPVQFVPPPIAAPRYPRNPMPMPMARPWQPVAAPPAFARQYGWRPAPRPWAAPRPQSVASPMSPAPRQPLADGRWRPHSPYMAQARRPVFAVPTGTWRPVAAGRFAQQPLRPLPSPNGRYVYRPMVQPAPVLPQASRSYRPVAPSYPVARAYPMPMPMPMRGAFPPAYPYAFAPPPMPVFQPYMMPPRHRVPVAYQRPGWRQPSYWAPPVAYRRAPAPLLPPPPQPYVAGVANTYAGD